jgi:hypothetical protein
MVNPDKFRLLGPMPAAVQTFFEEFLKFCLYIRAKFSKIFIRPCHLYSGVLHLPSTHKYAKPFYCSAFGLNITSGQIYSSLLYMVMNMQEISICLNILNTMKNCQKICSDMLAVNIPMK